MNLLRYRDLDLPTLPRDTPVISPYDADDLPTDQKSFVRAVRVGDISRELGLQKTLKIADSDFNRIVSDRRMKSIGATIVPHTWSFIPIADDDHKRHPRLSSQERVLSDLPKGLALVVEVARITPIPDHPKVVGDLPDGLVREIIATETSAPILGYEYVDRVHYTITHTQTVNRSLSHYIRRRSPMRLTQAGLADMRAEQFVYGTFPGQAPTEFPAPILADIEPILFDSRRSIYQTSA